MSKTISKFVKTLRQIVTKEWNGTLLYPNYPNLNDVHNTWTMRAILVKADTKANQMAVFDALVEQEGDIMPFASAVHEYLRQHDTEWYNNEYAGRDS
jgi:hypothetical protein